MLYLVTGLTQTGKTCNAVQWVLEHSQRSNRPVCHNGRFIAPPQSDISHWTRVDVRNWQDQPDGSVFFVDACHHDFPARRPGQDVPEYIRALVQHDKRGMDFYLVTQHPGSVDSFVLDQVHPPGWHRHLLRTPGANTIRCLEWGQANLLCARSGSETGALVTTISLGASRNVGAAPRAAAPKKTAPGTTAKAAVPKAAKPAHPAKTPPAAAPHGKVQTDSIAPEKPAWRPLPMAALAHAGKVAASALLCAGTHTARRVGCAIRWALHAARHRHKAQKAQKTQKTAGNDLDGIHPAVHGPAETAHRRFSPWMVAALLLGAGAAALGWRMWSSGADSIALPVLGEVSLPSPIAPGKNAAPQAQPAADASWRDRVPSWVPFVHNNETLAPPDAGGSPSARSSRRGGQEQQPLSCAAKENDCRCFNPQGGRVQVSDAVCRQIVLQGE